MFSSKSSTFLMGNYFFHPIKWASHGSVCVLLSLKIIYIKMPDAIQTPPNSLGTSWFHSFKYFCYISETSLYCMKLSISLEMKRFAFHIYSFILDGPMIFQLEWMVGLNWIFDFKTISSSFFQAPNGISCIKFTYNVNAILWSSKDATIWFQQCQIEKSHRRCTHSELPRNHWSCTKSNQTSQFYVWLDSILFGTRYSSIA